MYGEPNGKHKMPHIRDAVHVPARHAKNVFVGFEERLELGFDGIGFAVAVALHGVC